MQEIPIIRSHGTVVIALDSHQFNISSNPHRVRSLHMYFSHAKKHVHKMYIALGGIRILDFHRPGAGGILCKS